MFGLTGLGLYFCGLFAFVAFVWRGWVGVGFVVWNCGWWRDWLSILGLLLLAGFVLLILLFACDLLFEGEAARWALVLFDLFGCWFVAVVLGFVDLLLIGGWIVFDVSLTLWCLLLTYDS